MAGCSFDKLVELDGSGGLSDLACLDAGGADLHPARATRWRLNANRL